MLRVGISKYGLMRPECMNIPGPECEAGFELELFSLLIKLMKVEIEIKIFELDTNGCGYIENGTWNGLIGMLQRDEIDMIANLCLLDQDRLSEQWEWMEYSWPVLQQRQSFLIKAPKPQYEFNVLGPFQLEAWMTVFFTILLFVLFFAAIYKIKGRFALRLSLKKAFVDVLIIIFGLNYKPFNKYIWFYFTSFVGLITVLYSTFITSVILKPVEIGKPFKDNRELARVLHSGKYRILDYNKNPYVKCYENETCNMINEALKMHGFYSAKNSKPSSNAPTLLLNELLENPNLVLIKNRYQIRVFLNEFADRSKLWLLEDENAGEDWLVYIFRQNSTLEKLINQCLIEIGSGRDNVRQLYQGMSYQTQDTRTIKGQTPKMVAMDINEMSNIIKYYVAGVLLAIFSFAVEKFFKSN